MKMVIKKWKDILSITSGKNQREVENPNGRYPIFGSGGIIGRSDSFLCEANTVIIGRKGTIDNPIYVSEPFWNIDTAFGLVSGEELFPKYLYYFCKIYNFKALDKFTGRPSLSKSDLLKVEIPVPPFEDQHRIVTRIEEFFSQLDSGVETLKKTKEQLKVYRQAVLKEIFEKYNNFCKISEVCSNIVDCPHSTPKWTSSGKLCLRTTNFRRSYLDLSEPNYV